MKAAEILKAARKLIEKPEDWTKGAYALDAAGQQTNSYARDGACFCGVGAVNQTWVRAGGDSLDRDCTVWVLAKVALSRVAKARGFACFQHFNDDPTTSHADVLKAFDEAIARLEVNHG